MLAAHNSFRKLVSSFLLCKWNKQTSQQNLQLKKISRSRLQEGARTQSKENHRQVYQSPHCVKKESNPAQGTEGGEEEKADPELAHGMLTGANSYGAVEAEGV